MCSRNTLARVQAFFAAQAHAGTHGHVTARVRVHLNVVNGRHVDHGVCFNRLPNSRRPVVCQCKVQSGTLKTNLEVSQVSQERILKHIPRLWSVPQSPWQRSVAVPCRQDVEAGPAGQDEDAAKAGGRLVQRVAAPREFYHALQHTTFPCHVAHSSHHALFLRGEGGGTAVTEAMRTRLGTGSSPETPRDAHRLHVILVT